MQKIIDEEISYWISRLKVKVLVIIQTALRHNNLTPFICSVLRHHYIRLNYFILYFHHALQLKMELEPGFHFFLTICNKTTT